MTREQAIDRLSNLIVEDGWDEEQIHGDADEILIEFLASNGFNDVAETYLAIRTKVGFWYA